MHILLLALLQSKSNNWKKFNWNILSLYV